MKKLFVIALVFLALPVQAFSLEYAFVLNEGLGFFQPSGIDWKVKISEVAIGIDSPDLSQLYVIDFVGQKAFKYDGTEPFVAPFVESDVDFVLETETNLDESCDFFLLRKDRDKLEEKYLPRGNWNITVVDSAEFWLLVDADDFTTCSIKLSVDKKNVDTKIQFNKIPSAYQYIEDNKYECRTGEYCLRDPKGQEISITKLQCIDGSKKLFGGCVACPYDTMLNGELACNNWYRNFLARRYERDLNALNSGTIPDSEVGWRETMMGFVKRVQAEKDLANFKAKELNDSIALGGLLLVLLIGGGFIFKKVRDPFANVKNVLPKGIQRQVVRKKEISYSKNSVEEKPDLKGVT